MPALAYLRRSRVDARRPGHVSYEQQLDAVRRIAAQHGDDPAALVILEDWGRSGRAEKQAARKGYAALVEMIEAGGVTALYAYSMNRLARSLETMTKLAKLCAAHAVPIRCADGFSPDISTSTGRLVSDILSAVHEWQATWTAERMAEASTLRRKRGDHMGPASYGFRIVGGQLVDRPEEDFGRVIAAYEATHSIQGTARRLNAENVPTRAGRPWTASSVRGMLSARAPELLPAVKGTRAGARAHTFTGLLRCPHDGSMLGGHARGGRVAYGCRLAPEAAAHPRPWSISAAKIQPWAEQEAARLVMPGDTIEGEDAEAAAGERVALEARKRRIADNYEDGLIPKTERDAKLAAIEEAAEKIERRTTAGVIPQAVDWDWPPRTLNGVLKALWEYVELGPDLRPIRAEWIVPEYRAPD